MEPGTIIRSRNAIAAMHLPHHQAAFTEAAPCPEMTGACRTPIGKDERMDRNYRIPTLIPKPLRYEGLEGMVTLGSDSSITFRGRTEAETDEIRAVAGYLAIRLRTATGFPFPVMAEDMPEEGGIHLGTGDIGVVYGAEGYRLDVGPACVVLTANAPEGLFRGIQTVRQLLPAEIESDEKVSGLSWSLPSCRVRLRNMAKRLRIGKLNFYEDPAVDWE